MTRSQAYKVIAERIWMREYPNHSGCLVPSGYRDVQTYPNPPGDPTPYNIASDILNNKFKATHFSLTWKVKGKSVLLSLMSCDGFGAARGGNVVHEVVVKVEV